MASIALTIVTWSDACMQAPYTVTVHSSQYDAILNAYNAAPTGNMTNGTATMQVTNSALSLAADSSTSANVTFTVSASSQVKALAVQFPGGWSRCSLLQLAEHAVHALMSYTSRPDQKGCRIQSDTAPDTCSHNTVSEEGHASLQRLYPRSVTINGNECIVELNITLNNLQPGSTTTAGATSLDAQVEQSSVS